MYLLNTNILELIYKNIYYGLLVFAGNYVAVTLWLPYCQIASSKVHHWHAIKCGKYLTLSVVAFVRLNKHKMYVIWTN